jgi:hypothetical protein
VSRPRVVDATIRFASRVPPTGNDAAFALSRIRGENVGCGHPSAHNPRAGDPAYRR